MGKRNKIENTTVSETHTATTNTISSEKRERPITYVVVRDGFRVSDKEYQTLTDPDAIKEKEFWSHIANSHSYGELVEIVQYDSKIHRVW